MTRIQLTKFEKHQEKLMIGEVVCETFALLVGLYLIYQLWCWF